MEIGKEQWLEALRESRKTGVMHPLLLKALRESRTKGVSHELCEAQRENRECLNIERQAEEAQNHIQPHEARPEGTKLSPARNFQAAKLRQEWRKWVRKYLRNVRRNKAASRAWRFFGGASRERRALKWEALGLLYGYYRATLAIPKRMDSTMEANVRAASRKDRNFLSAITRKHQHDNLAREFPLEPFARYGLTMMQVVQQYADAGAAAN